MQLDPWAFDTPQLFKLFPEVWGYLVSLGFLGLLVGIIRANRQEWRRWLHGNARGYVIAVALAVLATGVFVVSFPAADILPLPGVPDVPPAPAVPLFGSVIVMLVGAWLGLGPAIVLAMVAALVRVLWLTGRVMQVLECGLLAALVAFMLRQNFRGKTFAWLRRPAVAGLTGGLAASFLAFLSLFFSASTDFSILPVVDFGWSYMRASMVPNLIEWLIAGLLVELALGRLPALRPAARQLVPPPYEYSLTRRFLYLLIPLFAVVIVLLLVAVTGITIRSATDLTLQQMAHDARVASDAIPNLNLISNNLLARLAQDQGLLGMPGVEQEQEMASIIDLERELRTTAYFRQLLLFDASGKLISAYPPVDEEALPLSPEEEGIAHWAATLGLPRSTGVWVREQSIPMLTHAEPILDANGQAAGALLGRVDLGIALQPVVSSLQGTVGAGRGFIVDENWSVVAHPNAERVMLPWVPPQDGQVQDLGSFLIDDEGHAYRGVASDGSRQLVYYMEGVTHPWTVVVIVPYEQVLSLATKVATPLTMLLLAAGVALALGLAMLTRQVNRPLSALVQAAGAIAQQDLDSPISVSGEDEVGRLGRAFEMMRRALRGRLGELQLLLGISQGAAASLDLGQGLPPILDGALEATGAQGVRIVAFAGKERGPVAFSRGELAEAMAPLDFPVARLLRRESSLRIDNTARTRTILDTQGLKEPVGAVLALPLRTSQGYQGVLWLAYREPHPFSSSETAFMTTLAGQASILVENVQLFEAAEGERRRLSAILSSTSDAVIVTDAKHKVQLLNPAAESAFGVVASQAMGQPVTNVLDNSTLVGMLTGKEHVATGEISLPNSRVLYASVSSLSGDDHQTTGRVVVLRDITHLKELDEMKTEFVNTVSHDLRGPLTFMRGYVTMLPMIGELSSKQGEYVEKILVGVDQMTELVEDLLNLASIESDVDQIVQQLQIAGLVRATAEGYRSRAENKGVSLVVDVDRQLPEIMGEPALLRQAVSNLVDNAIKYTRKGEVIVRAFGEGDEVIIQVKDSGPGVAPADQVRLFEKFYRVKRRDMSDIKGSGLGLAIVKSIVERRHKGRVWIESQLGAGSSFYIAIPCAKG